MYVITRENVTSVVRTVIPFVYAWVATNIPNVVEFIESINMTQEGFVLAGGALVYQLIRLLAERWGWIGNLLIINTKPKYTVPVSTPDDGLQV